MKTILTFLTVVMPFFVVAQSADTTKETIFQVVEQMPSYPGGKDSLMAYLSHNTTYPEAAQLNKIEGTVYVQFVVNKTGQVEKVKLARGVDKDLDAEAIRVVAGMATWTPGYQNGKPVSVYYTVPLRFKLQNNNIVSSTLDNTEPTYQVVEKMPSFPGGNEGLMKYLGTNTHYPEAARLNSIEGIVYVQFVVDKGGNITNLKTIKAVDKDLDAEAMRVVAAMPTWTPGYQSGKPVNVYYTVPIRFKLNNGNGVTGSEFRQVELLYYNHDYKKALKEANRLQYKYPASDLVALYQGRIYLKLGKMQDACESLNRAKLHGNKDAQTLISENCK